MKYIYSTIGLGIAGVCLVVVRCCQEQELWALGVGNCLGEMAGVEEVLQQGVGPAESCPTGSSVEKLLQSVLAK